MRYFPTLLSLLACVFMKNGRRCKPGEVVVEYHCVDSKDLPGWKAEDLTEFREALQWIDASLSKLMINLSKLNSVVAAANETLTHGLSIMLGVGSVGLAVVAWLLSLLPTWFITSVGLTCAFGPWILRMMADTVASFSHELWAALLVLPLVLWPPQLDRIAITTAASAAVMLLRSLLAGTLGGDESKGSKGRAGGETGNVTIIDTAPPCDGTLHVLVDRCSNVLDLPVLVDRCSNVVPADKNGLSDVYVKIKSIRSLAGRKEKKTKVKSKTLDPIFDEALDISILVDQISGVPQLCVEVWDWDLSLRDDYLGETAVDLHSTFAASGWLAAPVDCEYELADPDRRLADDVKNVLMDRIASKDRSVCPFGSVRLNLSFTPERHTNHRSDEARRGTT